MRRAIIAAAALSAAAALALAQPAGLRPSAAEAHAGPEPDLAYGAYQRGLYLLAVREATTRLSRDPDDTAAMTLLGELHNQGLGIRQDPQKAAQWFRLGAQRGDAHAAAALAMMAIDGRGMERDREFGRRLLEEAAAKREPAACYNLALILLSAGAEGDFKRAADLLEIAARAEIPDAQHALGVLYLRGRGMPRDPAKAAFWFRKAAENGNTAGEVEYAILLFNGEGVAADERLAARYFRRAAGRGNAIAQNRLARLYAVGRGVPKNLVESAAWHLLAASRGLTDAWLDQTLKILPAEDRAKAEKPAADRADLI
jgi:TPR repeat protein